MHIIYTYNDVFVVWLLLQTEYIIRIKQKKLFDLFISIFGNRGRKAGRQILYNWNNCQFSIRCNNALFEI